MRPDGFDNHLPDFLDPGLRDLHTHYSSLGKVCEIGKYSEELLYR